MKLKWIISTTAIALLIAVAFLGLAGHDSVVAAQDESSKIEGLLLDRFSTDGNADFIVRFTNQADLSPAYAMDWDARGEFVYNTLRDTAANSQVNAKAILDAAGLKYQTFIAGNDLYVWSGTQTDASALAALPEVYFIRATRTYYIDPVVVVKPLENIRWAGDILASNALTTVGDSPNALAWGITDTKADQFWSAFGLQGDGILVANIDTGVQWNHPALDQSYKCSANPGDPACWADPSNICGGSPCDNQGHGTHTMGTMVADDDPGLTWQAGMAPNAQWIACKGCESNSCSEVALNACADWILAPGGNAANRPDVVNNSWGGGGGDTWYQAKVQAWVAAGVFPAFSAGNAGSGCNTLGSPGDYQESFGSAAHDVSRNIASFSSRGPSAFGHDPYTKPNISAPGVNVCSTVPTNAWDCGYSGTSMASPHTAGAVALLWSCSPSLVGQIDATMQLLQASTNTAPAGNCGAPPDGQGNYTFGYGYLDVLNAGISVCGGVALGTLDGYVYDTGGLPIEGATVNAAPGTEGNQIQATTDPTGYYTMDLVVGTYNVTASKVGFTSQTVNGVVVTEGATTSQNFTLSYLGQWTQLPLDASCPDWYRYDMEYYPGTGLSYILGGRSSTTYYGNIYSYNPVTNICTNTGQVMPVAVANYTIGLINNGSADLLCTFGGNFASTSPSDKVQCYNPIANTVAEATTLPGQLGQFIPGGVAVVDNIAYVFGGFRNWSTPYNVAETWAYDPEANTWTQKGDLTLGRGYIQVGVVDGMIYGFGGDTYDGTSLIAQTVAEVFDTVAGTWNDAAVTDLATASGEGRGFGFDTSSGYELAGQVVLAGGGIWSSDTAAAILYDVASDTYDESFPDLTVERRDHAGFFVPGDPGRMFVMGGYSAVMGGDSPPYAPPEYFEVNQTIPEPDIIVSPDSLAAELLPNDTITKTLTIENVGTLPLNWNITEAEGMKIGKIYPPSVPAVVNTPTNPNFVGSPVKSNATLAETAAQYSGPLAVLYDQTDMPGTNGFPSQDFEAAYDVYDSQGADDFVVPEAGWLVQSVYIMGSTTGGLPIPLVNVFFYADDAGLPGTEVYSALGIVPVDDGNANLTITLPSPAALPAGNYWLSVQAAMAFDTYGQFFWSTRSIQTNEPYAWVNPGDGFASGCTTWNYGASGCGVGGGVDPDALFRLEGTTMIDVPWLSEDPTAGTLLPGESVIVEVTFNSAGLTPGDYVAALNVNSNDPDTPVVDVPVTLTVLAEADLAITKTDSPDPVRLGEDLTYTLLVTNAGPYTGTLVTVVDTLPAGVTFVSASAGCSHAAGKVTCVVGELPVGDLVAITIVVTANVEGSITNTAIVSGHEVDPVAGNNTATQETTVLPATLYLYLPLVMK